jgi:hypothetical protein
MSKLPRTHLAPVAHRQSFLLRRALSSATSAEEAHGPGKQFDIRPKGVTHDVLNQASLLEDVNLYSRNAALQDSVSLWVKDAGDLAQIAKVGAFAGSGHAAELASAANANKPQLINFDRNGRRVDRVCGFAEDICRGDMLLTLPSNMTADIPSFVILLAYIAKQHTGRHPYAAIMASRPPTGINTAHSTQVRYHPAYHALMRHGIENQTPSYGMYAAEAAVSNTESGQQKIPAASGWRKMTPGSHTTRAALCFLTYQAEPSTSCPLTMTYAAVPTLAADPHLKDWCVRAWPLKPAPLVWLS